ncbi:hypothetical protein EWB00_004666 [Schistosoma japonicum]|uniref:Uncharacterized protein n=1 Tax=Schistosoma japonicum TaxID=6182 RepID=A0A4Z2DXX9_SCHJA|nr:hypothetical protein KSF78_0003321 [Schistosoma japonicum]KAH8866043.1 hypothetical protein KSF78_0003321 [Schistosoma japonicum]TNN21413.1 hypothetical protein EWB00_004666 [Schistosoma japonicum]
MTDSNTELSSFHFESRRINNSTLCSKCAASILNQDLDCLHMDTELTRPYSRFKVKPIIKTRDGLLHSRRACYDIGNGDETSSEHLLSSICKSSDSSNSHSFTSYWDPSEKLSYESSLVFIRKSNANIVESNEQSSRSKKHEKFISDDIWKGHSSKDNQQEVQRSVDSFNEINPISESSESALQLSPYLIDDPVQRFHARHYDKLYQYMMFVHSYLPIPVAITVEKYTGSKITAYILSDNSDKYERNVLHHLQTDSAYCNSNNKSSKSLQKISSNLILHFACNKHYSQCLYPGPLQNKCFSVKTKHSVYWMQLLILEVQFNRSKPLYITHPSMQLLRNLWNELKSDILHNLTCNKSEISPSNICVIGKNRENKNVTSRPASICDTLTKRREVLTNQKLQMNSKLHSRNSLKIKSKIKTRRQLGFFFIATRSYPTSKHLDGLCKELKEIGYFELFQMEKIKSTTEKGWFYLPVDEILRVKGKYRNGSQYLDHIEIKTCDRGTWLLKPHLNEYPSGLHKSNREKNLNKDCLINDHLELWLRGLQIAMVRSRRR